VSLRTPLAQVAHEDEVLGVSFPLSSFLALADLNLQDYDDDAFNTGVAAWLEIECRERVASGTQRRIQVCCLRSILICAIVTIADV
jgi:hypothetical protein